MRWGRRRITRLRGFDALGLLPLIVGGPSVWYGYTVTPKTSLVERQHPAEAPAKKTGVRKAVGRNANVAALNKRVNESERYSVNAVHKKFGEAMSRVKVKARD
jgi:hypothetical protein